jgi:uncharacterized protein YbjT (DUF2867 family)
LTKLDLFSLTQIENFSEWQFVDSINKDGKICTGCGNGRIPFIDAEDIARVVFHCLTDKTVPNTSVEVIGPELLTYDDVSILQVYLYRKFTHNFSSGGS